MENSVNNYNYVIFSQDVDEERITHSSSDNIKPTSYNDANEVADELFDSLRLRYQGNLETSMREREILFSIQFSCCIISVTR